MLNQYHSWHKFKTLNPQADFIKGYIQGPSLEKCICCTMKFRIISFPPKFLITPQASSGYTESMNNNSVSPLKRSLKEWCGNILLFPERAFPPHNTWFFKRLNINFGSAERRKFQNLNVERDLTDKGSALELIEAPLAWTGQKGWTAMSLRQETDQFGD